MLRRINSIVERIAFQLLRRINSIVERIAFQLHKILAKLSARAVFFIPQSLLSEFSMNNQARIELWYLSNVGTSKKPTVFTREMIDEYIQLAQRRGTAHYGITDNWFMDALDQYPIRNSNCVILGSSDPWYKSVCLYYGATTTTIEYNPLLSEDPRIRVMTPSHYDKHPEQFDCAVSISSFEHDGLGRYGDPINPNADLATMQKMKTMLKPGGHLFLSVPIGQDILVWNAHRVYGRIRFPLLIQGWDVVDTFGFEEALFDKLTIGSGENRNYTQPIFVLCNRLHGGNS